MTALLRYVRVSTSDQGPELQHDALTDVGCVKIFTDTASGAYDDRPQLCAVLGHLCDGDILMVWRLGRFGRSLRHLVDTVTSLRSADQVAEVGRDQG